MWSLFALEERLESALLGGLAFCALGSKLLEATGKNDDDLAFLAFFFFSSVRVVTIVSPAKSCARVPLASAMESEAGPQSQPCGWRTAASLSPWLCWMTGLRGRLASACLAVGRAQRTAEGDAFIWVLLAAGDRRRRRDLVGRKEGGVGSFFLNASTRLSRSRLRFSRKTERSASSCSRSPRRILSVFARVTSCACGSAAHALLELDLEWMIFIGSISNGF